MADKLISANVYQHKTKTKTHAISFTYVDPSIRGYSNIADYCAMDLDCFETSNGWQIFSYEEPQINVDDKVIYLPGEWMSSDRDVLELDAKYTDEVMVALQEFNKKFKVLTTAEEDVQKAMKELEDNYIIWEEI